MSQFQRGWRSLSQNESFDGTFPEPTDEEGSAEILALVASLAGLEVSVIALKRGGVAIHYGFGIGAGILYGALQGRGVLPIRARTILSGALFGAALFIFAEKLLTNVFSFPRQRSPLGSRKYGLASHVVYGVVTAALSGAIRQSL